MNCSFLKAMLVGWWLFFGVSLHAQSIRGRITDVDGKPIYSASLFVRELRLGTATNDEGYYELRLPEGEYTCTFQCIGYETETRIIVVGGGVTEQNIVLRERAFEIRELVVSNSREDPAYAMMRRVIAMAPYYMNQVSEYKADVYLKGAFHIGRISALIKRLGRIDSQEIPFKEGETYLEESYNEIEFVAPNKYSQRVIKKTGTIGNDNSNSAMSLINISLYDEKAFEAMQIISPLSTSAFSHYRFRYEGFTNEDNRFINKIRVTPVRKSRQLLSGYLYIVDDFWNIHSADLSGEFIMGITFNMQANFGEVNDNIWMPVSYRFVFDASILGNRGSFNYVASLKYNNIVENKSMRKPDALLLAEQQRTAMQQNQIVPQALNERTATTTRTSERIENLLEQENLSNRQAYQLARLMQREAEAEKRENQSLDITAERSIYSLRVDSGANRRDTAFWELMRPVPLSADELKSYQDKDIRLAAPPTPKDTTANANKTKSPFMRTTRKVLFGTNLSIGERNKYGNLQYRGLKPSQLGFNTVDGFYIGQKLTYKNNFTKKKNITQLEVEPVVLWAINRKSVMWNVDASMSYAPMRRGMANIKFGQTTGNFDGDAGINAFENSVSSLFFRRNYMKLYENNFVEARNTIDIANGLQLNTALNYSRRVMLENHSDYSFFYRDIREYLPNTPVNDELTAPLANNTAAVFSLSVNYTPRYFYRVFGNSKRMVRSDYPTFFASWQKGVNGLLESNSNFDHISVGLSQRLKPGLMQEFRYFVNGGMFVNRKSVFFRDFKHFSTVEIPLSVSSFSFQSFNLLEYYRYSTSDKYIETHLSYTTPFLVLKMLPFFSNRMLWSEGLQLSYLYAPSIKNYMELGYTIGMMGMWEAGVFVGFEKFKYRSFGVKFLIPISGTLMF